jgi:hypothetical protein
MTASESTTRVGSRISIIRHRRRAAICSYMTWTIADLGQTFRNIRTAILDYTSVAMKQLHFPDTFSIFRIRSHFCGASYASTMRKPAPRYRSQAVLALGTDKYRRLLPDFACSEVSDGIASIFVFIQNEYCAAQLDALYGDQISKAIEEIMQCKLTTVCIPPFDWSNSLDQSKPSKRDCLL